MQSMQQFRRLGGIFVFSNGCSPMSAELAKAPIAIKLAAFARRRIQKANSELSV
jgi:hypothetical protein